MIKNIFLVTMAIFLVVLGTAVISNRPKKQLTEIVPVPTVIDNRRLITVRGQKYDVTEFRKGHEGGDIFKCGNDMTAIFNNQHSNSQLARMERYLAR